MQHSRSRQDLYRTFIDFVVADTKRERNTSRRRMFSVFVWCFAIPLVVAIVALILARSGMFPRFLKVKVDWVILIFPVLYSLYILSSEVLVKVPRAFRSGGIANSLGQSLKEAEWREKVCDSMGRTIEADAEDWDWLIESFRIDLKNLQNRARFLTALAGAVLFLIMEGLDSLGGPERDVTWVKTAMMGWVETQSSDLNQFVGLALFLILVYLSGNQNHQALERYLNCAELLKKGKKSR